MNRIFALHLSCIFKLFFLCPRVDTTLVDFNDMKWERGDICFIFKGDADPADSLIVLDNKKKVFQRARNEVSIYEKDNIE